MITEKKKQVKELLKGVREEHFMGATTSASKLWIYFFYRRFDYMITRRFLTSRRKT